MIRAWEELKRRNRLLAWLGLAHLAVLAVLLVLMMADDRQLTGVNLWLKPSKFALSITVYLWTMAWLLGELRSPRWLIGLAATTIAAAMVTEQFLITLQAARETTSHYNIATPFDAAVFSLMGIGVAVNSAAAALVLGLFLFHPEAGRSAYIRGIQLGLMIFLLGSAQGFVMIANAGHTVGGADGGPGIPLLAWSVAHGDLRVAHFLGIHAIQVLPLAGWLLQRRQGSSHWKLAAVWVISLIYGALGLGVHLWALQGRALFAWWG